MVLGFDAAVAADVVANHIYSLHDKMSTPSPYVQTWGTCFTMAP